MSINQNFHGLRDGVDRRPPMGIIRTTQTTISQFGPQASKVDLWSTRSSQREMKVNEGADSTDITTPGGYKLKVSGNDAATGGRLEITAPDGKKTTVWGDPHVDQQDSKGIAKRAFDVKCRTTFTLPDKTVITMNMKPSGNGSDTTMLSDLMVTNGNKGVLCSDMMEGPGKMRTDEGYGPLMDDLVDDGNVLHLGKNGEFYQDNEFGGRSKVTQERINESERRLNGGCRENTGSSGRTQLEELMAQLQQMLSQFDPGFMSMVNSGEFQGYSSGYPGLGMQHLSYNQELTSWA